jgi:hypothetical protein
MKWGTISFFGVRLREAARWSCQRPSGQLANAHRQERTTKEYLRADRLALRRSPRERSRDIDPGTGAPPSHFEPVPACLKTRNAPIELGWE